MLPAGDAEVYMFLFGNFRYQKVIESCALQPDIDMLPAGDATEIGEKVWPTSYKNLSSSKRLIFKLFKKASFQILQKDL